MSQEYSTSGSYSPTSGFNQVPGFEEPTRFYGQHFVNFYEINGGGTRSPDPSQEGFYQYVNNHTKDMLGLPPPPLLETPDVSVMRTFGTTYPNTPTLTMSSMGSISSSGSMHGIIPSDRDGGPYLYPYSPSPSHQVGASNEYGPIPTREEIDADFARAGLLFPGSPPPLPPLPVTSPAHIYNVPNPFPTFDNLSQAPIAEVASSPLSPGGLPDFRQDHVSINSMHNIPESHMYVEFL